MTAGMPNVRPTKLAKAPPMEWPTTHKLAFGYQDEIFSVTARAVG